MFGKSFVSIYFLPNKLLVAEVSSNRKKVVRHASVDLPEGVIENYKVVDPGTLAKVLKSVWNKFHFNEKTVGLIFGKHESGTIYISNIIVAKENRRKGIGTKLIQKAEEFGKKLGDHKIWLITGKHYPEDPFFKNMGFIREALLPNHYFHKDFVVYTKEINYGL